MNTFFHWAMAQIDARPRIATALGTVQAFVSSAIGLNVEQLDKITHLALTFTLLLSAIVGLIGAARGLWVSWRKKGRD